MIARFAMLIFLFASGAAYAVEPDERLADAALEARARVLSKDIRCLVCQNQSIDDSSASLARDLRILLRERLVTGDSDEHIFDFLVARYGDFILLKPPVKASTYALWFGPPAIFVLALIALFFFFRSRPAPETVIPSALSGDERARLATLLDDNMPGDNTPSDNTQGIGAPDDHPDKGKGKRP
jgi:cytochrome c-type biogenesis protein CcmH